jgi:hypothetical protein
MPAGALRFKSSIIPVSLQSLESARKPRNQNSQHTEIQEKHADIEKKKSAIGHTPALPTWPSLRDERSSSASPRVALSLCESARNQENRTLRTPKPKKPADIK